MKLLMIRPCEPSVNGWMKGDFLENLMLVAWSREDGRAFVYKLSARYVGLMGGSAPVVQSVYLGMFPASLSQLKKVSTYV